MNRLITNVATMYYARNTTTVEQDLKLLNTILHEADYYIKLYGYSESTTTVLQLQCTLYLELLDKDYRVVEMGSDVLDTGYTEHHLVNEDILANRMLLIGIMHLANFTEDTYWWCYNKIY
ncbi:MAG: hypothetical protein P857_102 [Candidatus Xenolissoclinum pacificiensis L6]|uniref:Uncharacterized protein n=1 Tax=Candidatus Xenolissoclinum pacificiensis L6 TaxID=1401685 RepID=W2V046_9RICK|nr:MAG: hypothetical protein P857_102 [Candidatus Xenolissoclinum pacificiensis L6]